MGLPHIFFNVKLRSLALPCRAFPPSQKSTVWALDSSCALLDFVLVKIILCSTAKKQTFSPGWLQCSTLCTFFVNTFFARVVSQSASNVLSMKIFNPFFCSFASQAFIRYFDKHILATLLDIWQAVAAIWQKIPSTVKKYQQFHNALTFLRLYLLQLNNNTFSTYSHRFGK